MPHCAPAGLRGPAQRGGPVLHARGPVERNSGPECWSTAGPAAGRAANRGRARPQQEGCGLQALRGRHGGHAWLQRLRTPTGRLPSLSGMSAEERALVGGTAVVTGTGVRFSSATRPSNGNFCTGNGNFCAGTGNTSSSPHSSSNSHTCNSPRRTTLDETTCTTTAAADTTSRNISRTEAAAAATSSHTTVGSSELSSSSLSSSSRTNLTNRPPGPQRPTRGGGGRGQEASGH